MVPSLWSGPYVLEYSTHVKKAMSRTLSNTRGRTLFSAATLCSESAASWPAGPGIHTKSAVCARVRGTRRSFACLAMCASSDCCTGTSAGAKHCTQR